jgi:D-alanyl-D-alanine-carboxypeptidase/D-alanyl-D-alanine-endopeptidase
VIIPDPVDDAVERMVARHGKQHVGLVLGAVTSAGVRAVVPVGHIRAPDGPTPRADTLTRGELSLDTPLADLLPEVNVPSHDGAAITVEHLATHTSGLPNNPMHLPAALWLNGRLATATRGMRSTAPHC